MDNPIEESLSILPHEKLIEILLALDNLEDIFNACRSSTIFARVCQDDYFWKLRYQQDFGSGRLSEGTTLKPYITSGDSMPWKELYKSMYTNINSHLSSGENHLGVIDRKGQLNMWGDNQFGQLGNGTKITTKIPQMVLSNVRQVSCGAKITGAVTMDGKVYTWGTNYKGRLGIGSYENEPKLVPTLVELPKKIKRIDFGYTGSMVLTEDGEIYVWGGLIYNLYTSVPIKLNLPRNDNKAISIGTGFDTFAAITKSGKLYMWGKSSNHIYLIGNLKDRVSGIYNPDNPEHRKFIQPTLIPFPERIRQISMGMGYFSIVTKSGELWMAGSNHSYEIGEYPPDKKDLDILENIIEIGGIPTSMSGRITVIPRLIHIKLPSQVLYFNSRWGTSSVKLKDGRVLMWGNNAHCKIIPPGYLGKQTRGLDKIFHLEIKKPIEISLGHQIIYIMAGGQFTVAITDDDYINIWGNPIHPW